ncbi:MAG TPA: RNA pseudouridine synthase [Pseudobdellovibrionaceae bacterium]|nr:RNA pseudouridine synthase [Pseudobdellovibrionaceae bacterium]
MNLPILIENENFLAIDKATGLSVHNERADEASVLSLLSDGFYLVHRLDKETSGVLLLAKSKIVAQELASAFQARETKKLYSAVLRGELKTSKFEWSWPISDQAEGRKNPQGLTQVRKESLTKGEIISQNKFFSFVRLQIFTGRQHQIRKHAALAKHPIVGDPRYNDPKYNQRMADLYKTSRMFLHAEELEFVFRKVPIKIRSETPIDFQNLII